MFSAFRHSDPLPNLLAIAYAIVGWGAGVWLMTRPEWLLNVAGLLLTAHALVYSAYLIHECAHSTIFVSTIANDRLGILLGWLNGACVGSYAGLKDMHLRHHADRMDVVTFDYRAVLRTMPRPVLWIVLALEWAYVPTVDLLMRCLIVSTSLTEGTREERTRAIGILLARAAFFGALAFVSVKAVLLYAVAYLIFLNVLRFMDAFQHTYDVFPTRSFEKAPADPTRNRQYEQENTYSNLVSIGWPWLDLLVMNFSYHNAHHAKPALPWYRLPALHRSLYGERSRQVIPCRALLANYHKYRVERVMASDYGTVAAEGDRAKGFIGAVGVSFLTAV